MNSHFSHPLSQQQAEDKAVGCILGGAIGDALGGPVEFLSLDQIRSKYGPNGIQEFDVAYGKVGAITDDTQMTLFTIEGLIRANVRGTLRGVCHPPSVVGYAYQRWMKTQSEPYASFSIDENMPGWLVLHKELYHRRAPGLTCLSALRQWKESEADNQSKGCGTVMRSAPFAFFYDPWKTAYDCAGITHGHEEAKVSSAILAQAIYYILESNGVENAFHKACELDTTNSLSSQLVRTALDLAHSSVDQYRAIETLGLGWVAEEALAIGVYAAVKADRDYECGVRIAVNHSGDSDSTGSICGNIMGAFLGERALPSRWVQQVELSDVIREISVDMVTNFPPDSEDHTPEETKALTDAFWDKYPGY